MSEASCPGCAQRDALIAELQRQVERLQRRVEELEARLGRDSSNSSLPPSANPPSAKPPVKKKPTGRKRGGQRGHKGHSRLRLPASRIDHTIPLVPDRCDGCGSGLPAQPSPDDPQPTWHQLVELPRFACVVTEFQGHARTCACCGKLNHAAIPAPIRAVTFGPRLAAALSYLGGSQHVSTRGLEEVVETLFGVPISLGAISALQGQMSRALEGPHQSLAQEVARAPALNVDETSWKQNGQKRWLWVAVTATAVFFLVHLRRNAEALKALLGGAGAGIITSDRYSVYQAVPTGRRQLCWAHLKRDFAAMAQAGGEAGAVGEDLLVMTGVLFDAWYKVRDGTRTRRWLVRLIEELVRPEVLGMLRRGSRCSHAPSAGTCGAILELEEALWTFARHEGVEPTNNEAERALRGAVIKRKKSFGSHSPAGCEYVARLYSVVQTLRKRGACVLDYLSDALDAFRHGSPAPQLPAPT